MALDEHITIHDLVMYDAASFTLGIPVCTRKAWIWLGCLIESSPPGFQQGTWEHWAVPTSRTLFDNVLCTWNVLQS